MPEESRQQRRAREREKAAKKTSQDKQLSRVVGGMVDGKSFHEFEAWDGQGVPTRDNCDLTNPRQALLWTFTAMPGMQGAPLMLPTEYWELQSWRQWVLGIRPAEEPTQKWQAPVTMAASPHMAAGKWVDLDTPEPERKTLAQMIQELPQGERAAVRKAVLDGLGVDEGERPGPPAVQYTVASLAARLKTTVPELLDVLANLGVTNLTADSRVSLDVANRIAARVGL